MEDKEAEFREIYEGMNTDALLELHAAGTLTGEAYSVLESVLESRSASIPKRPSSPHIGQFKLDKNEREEKIHCAWWAKYFAAIGIILPVICLIFNLKPEGLLRVCEVCWPTGFLLFAMDGHFNLAIVLISIILNAFIWAGLGWLIGYGTSNRIER